MSPKEWLRLSRTIGTWREVNEARENAAHYRARISRVRAKALRPKARRGVRKELSEDR